MNEVETAFCTSCGAQINAAANFCPHCGAAQPTGDPQPPADAAVVEPPSLPDEIPAQPPSAQPPAYPPPAGARIEQMAPGAGELTAALSALARTPLFAGPLLAAALGLGACIALGLVLALALPDRMVFNPGSFNLGIVTQTLFQAALFSLAPVGDGATSARIAPLLYVAIPLGATAWASYALAPQTAGTQLAARLASGVATGFPFAIGMLLIAAIAGGETNLVLGAVFGLSLLWGVLGGLFGTAMRIERESPGAILGVVPVLIRPALGAIGLALRPLAILLVAMALIATAIGAFQVLRSDDVRDGRSAFAATLDTGLMVADSGVRMTLLTSGASFGESFDGQAPIPIGSTDAVEEIFQDSGSAPLTLFKLGDAVATPAFVALLALMLLPAAAALYGGFSLGRQFGQASLVAATAWGALVGPVWAVTMAILAGLTQDLLLAEPSGESAFIIFLLAGAALGAFGGAIAGGGAQQLSQMADGGPNPPSSSERPPKSPTHPGPPPPLGAEPSTTRRPPTDEPGAEHDRPPSQTAKEMKS